METIWMGIVPGPDATRVVVKDGPAGPTLLRARLPQAPRHPRALQALCEAIALWCGRAVHAAIAADGADASCATTPWLESLNTLAESPLVELDFVDARRPRSRVGPADDGAGHDPRLLRRGPR